MVCHTFQGGKPEKNEQEFGGSPIYNKFILTITKSALKLFNIMLVQVRFYYLLREIKD